MRQRPSYTRAVIWGRWRQAARADEQGSAENPFEDLLEEAPVIALLLDPENRVLAANAEARRYFAIAPERLPRSLLEVTRESRLLEILNAATPEAEVKLTHHQRTVRARVAAGPVPGQSLLMLTDVTQLRRLEVVRQEFVANLSHELKTPLTSLRLAVESLLGDPPPESRKRFAERALKETDHLALLVDNLRQLAEIEAGQVAIRRSAFRLRDLVEETALRSLGGRPLNLEVRPSLELASDRAKLGEALGILLDNAAKFSPSGSAIDVNAEEVEDEVVIRVRDRGPGLSPEHWERVFERFYKVDPARSRESGGLGLGLAIAKHLVLALGGRVWTEASREGGQVFAISVPIHNP